LIEALLGEGLSAEALGVGDGGRAARALALGERDHPGDHGGGEQHADPGEQRPQAAVGAPLALGLTLAGGPALLEEGALELVQLGVVARRPVERRGEPGTPVELGRVAPGLAPLAGGTDQVLVKVATLGVLGKPVAQARPLAKQRLMGDSAAPASTVAGGSESEGPGGPSRSSSVSGDGGANPSACSSSAPARRNNAGRPGLGPAGRVGASAGPATAR
jgi:hypothetical protein